MKNSKKTMIPALLATLVAVPALIAYAAAPTAAPPTANVDANFNSVTAGYGTTAPTLGISGKGVTGAKFENSNATNTVNLGTATAAVDAVGIIRNAGLAIDVNGDISDTSGAVTVNDLQGMEIKGSGNTSTDLVVNGRIRTGDASGNGGVWVDSSSSKFVGSTGTNVGFWNGAWRLLVTNTGNVGIGTATPAYNLDVSGITRTTGNLYAGGNVGIGTTSPSYKLDVSGITRTTGNLYAGGNVGIGTTSPSYKLDVSGITRTTGDLYAGGNVGIGTTSPSYKLHVAGNIMSQNMYASTSSGYVWAMGSTGDFYNSGNINTGKNIQAVNGYVYGRDLYAVSGSHYVMGSGVDGSIYASGGIGISGNIFAGGSISSNGNISSGGSISSNGNISSGGSISANGSISSGGNITAYNGYMRASSIGKVYQKTYTWSDAEIAAATTTSDGDILFRFSTSSTTWVFPTPTCNGSDSALAVGGTGSWSSVNPGVNKIAQFKTDLSAQKGNIFLNDPDRALRRWSTTVKCFDPMGTASDTSTAATRWTT